jgi:hypothetical protein
MAVSGGGPKSCSMRLWDADVKPRRGSRDLRFLSVNGWLGKAEQALLEAAWDAHRTTPRRSVTLSWSVK